MRDVSKFVSDLDDSQIQLLKNLTENDPSSRVRMRANIILMSSKGICVDDIAFIYDIHRDTVSSRIDSWEKDGITGLYDKPRSGAPPKLTVSEVETVKKLITETPNSPKTVLAKITETTGKVISISTLKRIAKSAGLRWKRARKSLKSKRDEKEFRKAGEEIRDLKKKQQEGDIDLFYFDESGFSLNSPVPYAYQPVGETIGIPSSSGSRLNVLGFYNTDNRLVPFCFECGVDSAVVVACFDEFVKTLAKPTVVILDNASVHHSGEFEDNIPKWKEKGLTLKFLPAYSPELNLIEILWRFIKYHWLPFSAYLSFDRLVESVEDILRNVGVKYAISFV